VHLVDSSSCETGTKGADSVFFVRRVLGGMGFGTFVCEVGEGQSSEYLTAMSVIQQLTCYQHGNIPLA
jgi:hypothetical protein